MNTPEVTPMQGWVLYDGDCRFCRGAAQRWERTLTRHGFALAPLQTDWVRQRLGLAVGEVPNEMKVLTSQGVVIGGVDALLHIARHIWWARPVYWLGKIPWIKALLWRRYRQFAARRNCISGACKLPSL